MNRPGDFDEKFIKELDNSNRNNDPNLNAYRIVDKGDLVVSSDLVEYPKKDNPTRQYQKKDLDDVLADYSDMNPDAVDLDTDPTNLAFLQRGIRNLVKKDVELGEANINVGTSVPQFNTSKMRAMRR